MSQSKVTAIGTPPRKRDVRLDFFRGIAMLIIFMAHVPLNRWQNFIPANFGPSDATEMFVFCSGFASALAFGSLYKTHGFLMGTSRIGLRCFQVYWAHLAMFITIATVVIIGTNVMAGLVTDPKNYIIALNLMPFMNDPVNGLVGLMTLTYVPNYFDILPMYLVLLAMIPVVMLLSRVHSLLPIAAIALLWLANQIFDPQLPAEWWSDRTWFFDPFAWALIFFTGFSISIGWLKTPQPNRILFWTAVIFMTLLIPVSHWQTAQNYEWMREFRVIFWSGFDKTEFGYLRYLHFLALAYICVTLLKGREDMLHHPALKPVIKVGQQALATFISSMILAQIGGMALDYLGRSPLTYALVNLSGFALLIGIAYMMAFFKKQPWRKPVSPGTETAKATPPATSYALQGDRRASA